MNYFTIIIKILVLFAYDTVICGASGLGNLTIEVKKTNYNVQIPGLVTKNIYSYEVDDTLELKCGGPEPVFLEWTDERNKISQKSCSKIKDFTLILRNLQETDSQTTFMCNSTNEYNTITLVLQHRTDFTRFKNSNNKICYDISRDGYHKNCTHSLRKEVVTRVQKLCPVDVTETIHHYATNPDSVDNITTGLHKEIQEDSENSSTLLHAGVTVLAFISLTIIAFCIFKCFNKVKERKNNEPIYAEPNEVMYAELQVINDNTPKLPERNDPPYAQVVGILTLE